VTQISAEIATDSIEIRSGARRQLSPACKFGSTSNELRNVSLLVTAIVCDAFNGGAQLCMQSHYTAGKLITFQWLPGNSL
jgi:hypothetical protein